MFLILKVTLFSLIGSVSVFSKTQNLSVCTFELSGNMVKSAREGFLIDILKNTLGKSNRLSVTLYPPIRAFDYFAKGKCDVLVSAGEGFISSYASHEAIELPVGLRDYHSVVSHSKISLDKLDLEKPQSFVSLTKWFMPTNFPNKHTVYFAHSMSNALKMVKAKRAD